MRKVLVLTFAALAGVLMVSCSKDDGGSDAPAVGITSVLVTPAGSEKSYACEIDQSALKIVNSKDSVDWDVADAALSSTKIIASGTLGSTVYYNDKAIPADGVEVDASAPVTLTAKDGDGNSKSYTLTVVKAKSASGADMVKKASAFAGFPSGLIDYDMTVFKGKFYAIATSLSGSGDTKTENYQMFSSEDGLHWTEVAYQTDQTGVTLPEGQSGYVVGGEGARLAVLNDRMYVLGGARTMGTDKYGNKAEVSQGWMGPSKEISGWRCFSTSDGVTFKCDTVGTKVVDADGKSLRPSYYLPAAYLNTATIGNKLIIQGGYMFGFGMAQGARRFAYTTDGTNWTNITPTSSDPDCDVQRRTGNALFTFKGKVWCLGGFVNYISADNMRTSVYSSSDGLTWEKAGEQKGLPSLYHAKIVAGDNVVFLIGGEYLDSDGSSRVLSDKVYRSTDGVNWEEVATVPSNFLGVRNCAGVAIGNTAWIFGGNKTKTSGAYGYPMGDADELSADTWIKLFK